MEKDYNFKDRRKFIRHPLTFPLRYNVLSKAKGVLSGKKEAKSTTINISIGGLLFSSRQALDKGVLIDLKMPFGDKVFKVKARVVYCAKSLDTKLYNVGVSFHRVHDAFKVKLIEQLYLISEYRDLRSVQLGREVALEEASKEWIKRYSERFRRLYW
jgi:c-di-GMP-binding flagellar brake protein YcgR